ncbi:bifunctional 2-polyprenyl-6-hydroxyphenol methylase/3-demethylubiquinol 3-O-methyltransferase UbiG [Nitratiruptor sp. YY09-18]|uniref:class I SAM-dependent methyltransferase n=1 Tax=Nitratiruptor sp. YY09-18 TaxID=2724901 RepID=UPI001915DBD3|nr:hypothetical protein NitYY0918_C1030 [Nitratiruptor sp. YY09-18]
MKHEPLADPDVVRFYDLVPKGRALDIACGRGGNAIFLASRGFTVDAVDISDVALAPLKEYPGITPFCQDIASFDFGKNRYDLILNINFFERSIFENIFLALRPRGIFISKVFTYKSSMNPTYTAKKNELLELYNKLEIVYYNLDKNAKAILVGRKER